MDSTKKKTNKERARKRPGGGEGGRRQGDKKEEEVGRKRKKKKKEEGSKEEEGGGVRRADQEAGGHVSRVAGLVEQVNTMRVELIMRVEVEVSPLEGRRVLIEITTNDRSLRNIGFDSGLLKLILLGIAGGEHDTGPVLAELKILNAYGL